VWAVMPAKGHRENSLDTNAQAQIQPQSSGVATASHAELHPQISGLSGLSYHTAAASPENSLVGTSYSKE